MRDRVDAAAPPLAHRASLWEDFIDILYAPSQVFARRENASFWGPMLIVAFLLGVLFYLNSGAMQPVSDGEFNRGMAAALRRNPQLNPEAMERFRQVTTRMGQIFAFVIPVVIITILGLTTWIVGKLLDAKQTFRAAMVVAAYSHVPRVIEAVVQGVEALMMDPATLNGRFRLSLGPGRFIDPDAGSPLLLAVVGRIDVFTIWVTVLLAIGLSVTGHIPRSRAAIAGVIVWMLGALPLIYQAIRMM
jgi:hypothetical protein